jgi:DNA polymerase-3 subunit beta
VDGSIGFPYSLEVREHDHKFRWVREHTRWIVICVLPFPRRKEPARSNIQGLSSVHIEATTDGLLSFTGTDLDTFLVNSARGTVTEAGVVTVPARRFLDIVKELPADVVEIASTTSGISISCGQGKFRIVGTDPEEFPPAPDVSEDTIFAVRADVLDRLIRQTSYAVTTDFTRAELTAVFVKAARGTLTFTATDSHRLARATHENDYPDWGGILVPPKALTLVQRQLPEASESVSLSTSKRYCLFNLGNSRLYTRLLDGTYPPVDDVIPKNNEKKAVVTREPFMAALRRVAVMSESNTRQVKLSLAPSTLRLSVQTQNVGEADDTIEARYDGPEFHIGYNATYLLELLRTMESDEVELAFQGATSAGIFTPVSEGSPDLFCLVMPLRLPGTELAGDGVSGIGVRAALIHRERALFETHFPDPRGASLPAWARTGSR